MDLIEKWLSGSRNYVVGRALYKKFGTDSKLKQLLEGAPTPFLVERLAAALKEVAARPRQVLQQPAATTAPEASEMPATKDPVLEALRLQWLPKYQRMCMLRHQLDVVRGSGKQDLSLEAPDIDNTPEAIALRKPMVFEILDLEQECMRIWERRDYYMQNGRLPEEPAAKDALVIPEDPVEIGRLIESLKRNIRRNKKLAEDNPDNPTYPQKVKLYSEQLEQVLQQKAKS